eukprot:376588-Amphidinium_carterae.1
MLVANKPYGASTTERAIPVKIFSADYDVKKQWLRQWLQDASLNDFDMRSVIDWDYYKDRLCAVFQKLISIPAAYQHMRNPCPRVKMPDWLQKRVNEQMDRYQQRSLGLWLRKSVPAGGDALDDAIPGAKRKLGDIEDLANLVGGKGAHGQVGRQRALVEFGTSTKGWLDMQQGQWDDPMRPIATAGRSSLRASLFEDKSSWSQLGAQALRGSWHIIAIEAASSLRNPSVFQLGDKVIVQPDEELMGEEEEDIGHSERAVILSFVGSFVKVVLETGGEELVPRSRLKHADDESQFVVWVSVDGNGSSPIHRCEINISRRVILALGSSFRPEDAQRELLPGELAKGLRVWPVETSESRPGPGVVVCAAPEVGLCSVQWDNAPAGSMPETVYSYELQRQCGKASRVMKDAPRNLQYPCLVELELQETEFQQQLGEGALGDADAAWPRVDAVFQAEQPLLFDLTCRLPAAGKLKAPERFDHVANKNLRLELPDFVAAPASEVYMRGFQSSEVVYFYLAFDRA